ncbi:hypothetical protein VPH35_124481 [Triticum aestivum]
MSPFWPGSIFGGPSIIQFFVPNHPLKNIDCAKYQFVIFASDGLCEHLNNQEAVDIVHCSPQNVDLQGLCGANHVPLNQGVLMALLLQLARNIADEISLKLQGIQRMLLLNPHDWEL